MRRVLAALAVPLTIAMGGHAQGAAPVVTNAHWLKLPAAEDLERYLPAEAKGMSGAAKISCIVTVRGLMDKCVLLTETPPEHGFGDAALMLAPLFVLQPKMIDGVAVTGGRVNIPINFEANGIGPDDGDVARIYGNLPWGVVPTAAEVAAAYPERAAGHSESGHVVLRCDIQSNGAMTSCDIISEQPRGAGFGKAARNLVKTFRVADQMVRDKRLKGAEVDIPFDFRDPHQPGPPVEVNQPEWLQGADPAMAGTLFPVEAAKAGLKTGRAFVTCVVAHDGSLTGCAVSGEDPPGLGFGAAGLAIAGVMKMNPWTRQGYPVDGARIRLPIRVNLGEKAPAVPPAAPPKGQ